MRPAVLTLALTLWAHHGLSVAPGTGLFMADMGNHVAVLPELGDFGQPLIASNASIDRRQEDTDRNPLLPRQTCNGGHLCAHGRCCLDHENCVPGGCCDKPEQQCGSDHCYNPAESTCCDSGTVCGKGWVCVPGGGCCEAATPSRCGEDRCYDPKTQRCCVDGGRAWGCAAADACCSGGFCRTSEEQCCENGSCPRGDKCCEKECCRSMGFCGSAGVCEACPAATRTRSEEATATTTLFRRRVRGGADTGAAPSFRCVPMTATNEAGGTLELGDDCMLEYAPPEETTSDGVEARGVSLARRTAAPGDLLLVAARQVDCVPWTTVTEYTTNTVTETEWATTTAREGPGSDGQPQGDVEFSCPEMEVTNEVGDTLGMDETCGLTYTAAEVTGGGGGSDGEGEGGDNESDGGSDGQGGDGGGGGGGSPDDPGSDAAVVMVSAWAAWSVMFVGVLCLW